MLNLLGVMVVYNQDIGRTKTVESLISSTASGAIRKVIASFKLIIYDNSLRPQPLTFSAPFEYRYFHNPKNAGVAGAYNYAFEVALAEHFDWVLLLDHDSDFKEDFLIRVADSVERNKNNDTIVAYVPKIFHGKRLFSPSRVLWGGIHRPIEEVHVGVYGSEIMSIGSCSVLKTRFISELNGFNQMFWLDCLDRWLFYMIHARGKHAYVVDSFVHHELSIYNFNALMDKKRYVNQLKYETIFMKLYRSKMENLLFLVRLLKRAVVLLFVAEDWIYARITIKHLISLVLDKEKERDFS